MSETELEEANKLDVDSIIDSLAKQMNDLYVFRDFYFEDHPIDKAREKNIQVEEKMNTLIEKFNEVDENQLSLQNRARFLYMKGRTYNLCTKYDPRASQCLSKAVKLNPRLVDAWNELGECYWKNLNIKDAKSSFEGALKTERNKVTLRCLSITLRQECTSNHEGNAQTVQKSVDLAKEAVALDCKDGISWSVLANAYLCQYFLVAQEPTTLKSCLSAYKQAAADAVARGQPDLYYNWGVALKYDEQYYEALENFVQASRLDPMWAIPAAEIKKLVAYLSQLHNLVHTKGKIKVKKLHQMVQAIDRKMLGPYGVMNAFHTFGRRKDVSVEHCRLDSLTEGANEGKVILGKVVGSIHSENVVPFTFALIDESMTCVCVTVYNWADGKGVIIGDTVAVPEPSLTNIKLNIEEKEYTFKSIRVNNPMILLVNGKKVGRNQFAGTRVTSTYEIH